MSPPLAVTLTTHPSPARTRSVSQPVCDGVEFEPTSRLTPRSGLPRSHSSNSVLRPVTTFSHAGIADAPSIGAKGVKRRARSSSLVTVTEFGGDEPETVVDRLGVGSNENAAWVNAPGAWLIHPVLIILCKMLVDAIPSMTQDVSWTIVNVGHDGRRSTLWEQIDGGAQYTPANKWLTSVPIGLLLISTHYTKYDPVLSTLNFAALVFILFPKRPLVYIVLANAADNQLHRLRIKFLPKWLHPDVTPTSFTSRPPSPRAVSEAAKIAQANGRVFHLHSGD